MSKPLADMRTMLQVDASNAGHSGGPGGGGGQSTELWDRILRRLRAELGEEVFTSWFGRLELDGIANGVAQLSVPTKFLKSWIQSHYMDRMLAVVSHQRSAT